MFPNSWVVTTGLDCSSVNILTFIETEWGRTKPVVRKEGGGVTSRTVQTKMFRYQPTKKHDTRVPNYDSDTNLTRIRVRGDTTRKEELHGETPPTLSLVRKRSEDLFKRNRRGRDDGSFRPVRYLVPKKKKKKKNRVRTK